IAAPKSFTFDNKGTQSLATHYVESEGTLGEKGLTKARAHQILNGYAADVLLNNWDVIGQDKDNILLTKDGPLRVDNGSAFLHRAMGKLKPDTHLDEIREWEGFTLHKVNPQYAAVFKTAGISKPEEIQGVVSQIDAIEK